MPHTGTCAAKYNLHGLWNSCFSLSDYQTGVLLKTSHVNPILDINVLRAESLSPITWGFQSFKSTDI